MCEEHTHVTSRITVKQSLMNVQIFYQRKLEPKKEPLSWRKRAVTADQLSQQHRGALVHYMCGDMEGSCLSLFFTTLPPMALHHTLHGQLHGSTYTDSCYYCMRAADDKSSVTYAWSMWAPKLVKVNRFHASKDNWHRKLFFDINSFFDTGNLHLPDM